MGILERAFARLSRIRTSRELMALRRLFTDDFLRSLEADEARHFGGRPGSEVTVQLAWIDKIPIARFTKKQKDLKNRPIRSGVELGDLFIVRTEGLVAGGVLNVTASRSVVVQAKVATEPNAPVPVGRLHPRKANSTSKELKLLRDWPEFDLYETGGSAQRYLQAVNVDATKPHSFFWAHVPEPPRWGCAPPTPGSPCSQSLDSFFADLRGHAIGDDCLGATDWARLSEAVVRIATERLLPPSLGAAIGRVQQARYRKAGFGFPSFGDRKMAVLFVDVMHWETEGPIAEIGPSWGQQRTVEELWASLRLNAITCQMFLRRRAGVTPTAGE